MNLLETNKNEKNRILKLHLNEQTTSSAAGAYETPKAFDRGGELTQTERGDNLVGVDVVMSLPDEFDITGGNVGSFEDISLEGPENEEEEFVLTDMIIEPENEEEDDEFLPDTLLTLFGDVNIDGDLEIELDEEPQKMRGSRKWRK